MAAMTTRQARMHSASCYIVRAREVQSRYSTVRYGHLGRDVISLLVNLECGVT
jgi:hypothetical protein